MNVSEIQIDDGIGITFQSKIGNIYALRLSKEESFSLFLFSMHTYRNMMIELHMLKKHFASLHIGQNIQEWTK